MRQSDRICQLTEGKVDQALNVLESDGVGLPFRVVSHHHAERHSYLDRQHIDFEISVVPDECDRPRVFLLQVKSSRRKALQFERRYAHYRTRIWVIFVRCNDTVSDVLSRLRAILIQANNTETRRDQRYRHIQKLKLQKQQRRIRWRCNGDRVPSYQVRMRR